MRTVLDLNLNANTKCKTLFLPCQNDYSKTHLTPKKPRDAHRTIHPYRNTRSNARVAIQNAAKREETPPKGKNAITMQRQSKEKEISLFLILFILLGCVILALHLEDALLTAVFDNQCGELATLNAPTVQALGILFDVQTRRGVVAVYDGHHSGLRIRHAGK